VTDWQFKAPPPRGPLREASPPTFSVAIAAFQAAETAGAAVESALAQTRPPVEVVVCDDGSTDGLEQALAPYRDRIVFFRQENRGEAAAKTAAGLATTSDFVVFLDADDYYYPDRLAALAEFASRRPDLDVLTTNADLEADGQVVGQYYPDVARFPVEDQARGIIAHDSAVFGAAAVRRSVLAAAGGFELSLRSSSDWQLWVRLALQGSLIGLVEEPLYRYRLHEYGTSADQVRGNWDLVQALELVLAGVPVHGREREALEESLVRHRATARLVEAEAAVRAGRAPRQAAWRIASASDFPALTRLKAGVATAFPSLAARVLAARDRRTGRSRLRKPIPGRAR
jgi:glycosyltransferase involved in cell wall biosynthesis